MVSLSYQVLFTTDEELYYVRMFFPYAQVSVVIACTVTNTCIISMAYSFVFTGGILCSRSRNLCCFLNFACQLFHVMELSCSGCFMETKIVCEILKDIIVAKSSAPEYLCSEKGVNGAQ